MTSPVLQFLAWYVAITLLGWLTVPLAYRVLPGLADRGYTLARALGWLLWGYIFWLLASLHVLENNLGGEIVALALLIGITAWALRSIGIRELGAWLRENRTLIVIAELVFFLAFALWTFIRATDPNILYTEKPMEIAFINGILQSSSFPPSDPWLSGYAISYYYFGYVLVAMLVRLSGVAAEVGFNLAIALLFGLTALGAYGLVFNLLKNRRGATESAGVLGLPVLGPLFLLLAGNWEGFLQVLHDGGLFWQQTTTGLQSKFWTWLNIQDLNTAPAQPYSWNIFNHSSNLGGILWRASRVLSDYQLDGTFREVIDEFPFFSYQLADLHPHVLAMPFTLMVIGVGMNFFFERRKPGFSLFGLWIPMDKPTLLFSMFVLGALGFMNTWDFPIYVVLFAGAYALIRLKEAGWGWQRLSDFLTLAIVLGIGGIILYLPFYIGFSSQAKGFLPSVIFYTRGVHFWVMFASLLIPVIAYLVFLAMRNRGEFDWRSGLKIGLLLIGGLWLLSYVFAFLITIIPAASSAFLTNQIGDLSAGFSELLKAATLDRLKNPGTWLTLLGVFMVVTGLLIRSRNRVSTSELVEDAESDETASAGQKAPADEFALLMVLLGALLAIAPEFFYLWDVFGARMNTIFKFYYQVWMLWAIIAAYGTAVLFLELRKRGRIFFVAGSIVLLAIAMINPLRILNDKFGNTDSLSLDGLQYLSTDVRSAVTFLDQSSYGVVAEAVGGSYDNDTSVISRYTGYPTILGWFGHESQWGREYSLLLERASEVEMLYSSTSWEDAKQVIDKYHVRYVYIGNTERSTYQVSEKKFADNLVQVFQYGSVTIYEVPGMDNASTTTK